MLRSIRILSVSFSILIYLTSCQPVNFFTRLKKTPRQYTINYCADDVTAPKSEYDKHIWLVYSDRDNNPSFVNPGGKVKLKELGFMDAFLVLGRKGEYLQLIKYDPEIVTNMFTSKLKNRKKAQYYGWVHQSKLLLTSQSVTDMSSGFKNKGITIIRNTTTLNNPKDYFATDSIVTFKDENLITPGRLVSYNSIVYTLKLSANRQNSLVAKKTIISPDSVKNDVLGWIPNSLVRNLGQRLHVDLKTIPDSLLLFMDKYQRDTLPVSSWELTEDQFINRKTQSMKYNPVFYYKRNNQDTTVQIRTAIATPVINNKKNYVFNVNGNKISYDKFKEYESNLRKLNIIFVLEGHERVLESYNEIANVIQNLQPLFEKDNDVYDYKFGTILTSQGKTVESRPKIKFTQLTSNYTQMMDSLTAQIDSKDRKIATPAKFAWSGLRRAVDVLETHKDETNILIVIGGTGYSEWADSILVRRMGNLNCKILGFQMHGVKDVPGNNFVLQIENMIENSAKQISKNKREKLVYTDQITPQNLFRESSKNVYKLDFPAKSMSQGWILFPEKDAELPLDILTNSVDSLVTEVKADNENVITNLYNAFNTVGKQRNQYGEMFAKYNGIEDLKSLNKDFVSNFSAQIPVSYLPSQKINLTDSINQNVMYRLLLSKDELDDILSFVDKLSAIEVDIDYQALKERQEQFYCNCPIDDIIIPKQSYCNCPEDEDYMLDKPFFVSDTITNKKLIYLDTQKLRNELYQTYVDELTFCKLCKITKSMILEYTLEEAQQYITGSPSNTPLLSKYKIMDIKDKKKISDAELDILIEYFKEKKEYLIRSLSSLDKFESNDEVYYWLNQEMLP